jgi:hypothetical protein
MTATPCVYKMTLGENVLLSRQYRDNVQQLVNVKLRHIIFSKPNRVLKA